MKTFEEINIQIAENSTGGCETAILGKNGKAVKYGSLISESNELPDKPNNCTLMVWNNSNIDTVLKDYKLI